MTCKYSYLEVVSPTYPSLRGNHFCIILCFFMQIQAMKLPLWLWGSHSRRACPLPVTSDKHIRPQPSPQLGTKLYNLGSAHQKPPAQSVNWKEVKCQSRHTRDTDAFEPLQWFKLQHLKSRAKQVSGIH